MSEDRNLPQKKQLKTVFISEENLPTHYINSVNISFGQEEFFLTFGTSVPLEVTNINDLEKIESINAHAVFRCAMSRTMLKQMIDLMTGLYENQSQIIEQLQASQRKDEEYGDSNNSSSSSIQ